jgi:arylsulfatase A-like enzyme
MPSAGRAEQPNILLLVLDTVRADALEPYGAPLGSSPTLADLARRGEAISGVRATASWTLPSHIAMFTGRLARGLGLGQAPANTPQSAAPIVRAQKDRLIAERLRQSGYATAGVTTNAWVGKRTGFDTGFEKFVELDTSRHSQLGGGVRHRLRWDWEGARGRGDDGAAQAEAVIGHWIGELDARPFFWFVNLVECHSPYLPPKPYDRSSAITRLRAADEARHYLTFDAIIRTCVGAQTVPDGAVGRMRQLYAGSLRYVDDWVARLLGSLAGAGILDDTLIIVCSDHGENLGEAGLLAHILSVDDRLLRVPLIVAGPGASEFDQTLSLLQLPAQIATVAGLEAHPWDRSLPADCAVAQWDPLAPSTHPRVAEVIADWKLDEQGIRRLTSPFTCAVSDRFKLVRGDDVTDEELYDLESDPLELSPVKGGDAMVARAGGERIATLRAAVNDAAVQATAEVSAVESDTLPDDEVAEIERRMRLMGYM